MILDAERYKAVINNPPGMPILQSMQGSNNFVNAGIATASNVGHIREDDEFFHVTCHLDDTLRNKIEHGDYVELEKLLPRQRGWASSNGEGADKLDLIFKDGKTYLHLQLPQIELVM